MGLLRGGYFLLPGKENSVRLTVVMIQMEHCLRMMTETLYCENFSRYLRYLSVMFATHLQDTIKIQELSFKTRGCNTDTKLSM